jgi:hypothetical protein
VKRRFITLLLLILVFCSMVEADALLVNQSMWSPVIAEYFITEGGVDIELEIGVDGVATIKNLLPDTIYSSLGFGKKPVGERMEAFFGRELLLLDGNNKPLAGELVKIGRSRRTLRDPFNGTPLPIQDDAPEIIRILLHFSFNGDAVPEQLIFYAPVGQSIGFIAYHDGIAINDFRYLVSGFRLNLDWNDPWYSAFEGRKFRRQNYAPMSGFIYVEPFEVRKEIIARPKDLQRWIDLGLEGKTVISVEMQAEIKQKIASFLALHHPVTIDGTPAEGIFDSINFLERTMSSSRVIEPPEPLNIDSAILGTIFVYPRESLPQKVVMAWDLWDERIQSIPAIAVDQEGPMTSILEPDWTQLEWINFLKKPFIPTLHEVESPASHSQTLLAKAFPISMILVLLALVWLISAITRKQAWILPAGTSALLLSLCVTAALKGQANNPEPEKAHRIVGNLLHNIYRAFDYREESDIYDKLAYSVSGELLTDIFLETKRSLVLANQGGARAKVKDVTLQSLELKPAPGDNRFVAEVNWTVNGSVGHWGHIHQRSNRYQALLDIAVDDQQWKLQKMTVLQEERL